MARCLLVLPKLPQPMGAPYLGQQYVAAALMAADHEVMCIDLAAIANTLSDAEAARKAREFGPDVVGMTLFTYNALAGYTLREALCDVGRVHVSGGPHVTVLPEESLRHGFDVAVVGEGERAMVAIANAVDSASASDLPAALAAIPGAATRSGQTPGAFLSDLDDLPWPHRSVSAYDLRAYSGGDWALPGGTVTSRGCPARCTFCANYVTGRSFRYRSAKDVVAELEELRRIHDVRNFSFWDDAFTAHRPRLRQLCDAMDASDILKGTTWTCITPANMANEATLTRMRESGCVAVNFGIESGDAQVLRTIGKGQRPAQVQRAVEIAKGLGMSTVVNFMFGFPGEGPAQIGNTIELMTALSTSVDFFNNRGVLVPFPGTPVYEQHHRTYGFTDWWLDPRYLTPEPDISGLSATDAQLSLKHDPSLDHDFFGYDDSTRAAIASAVAFKAQHNVDSLRRMGAIWAEMSDEGQALGVAASVQA